MVAPLHVKKNILILLITAEKSGKPIALQKALAIWGDGSAWESLVDSGYIYRHRDAVTVTETGKSWIAKTFPEIKMDEIPSNNFVDGSGNEWDRMTRGQRISMFVFIVCLVLWGAPVLDATCGTHIGWIMPYAGVVAVITGLHSGMIFMIINSLSPKK